MANAAYRIKYVGGDKSLLDKPVQYLKLKDGVNDRLFIKETMKEIEAMEFEVPGESLNNISVYSVPVVVIEPLANITPENVKLKMARNESTWLDWNDKVSFGDYYGLVATADVKLLDTFHVKDGEFYTLNGIFCNFMYVTEWNKLFADYKNGSIKGNPIVGMKATFKNNYNLTGISPGLLQPLEHIQAFDECWMNGDSITSVSNSIFTYQKNIRSMVSAFEGTGITKIPSRFISIGTK